MSRELLLDLPTLRQAINKSLDHCEQRFGRQVDLTAFDFHWTTNAREAFDVTNDPNPAIGSLVDDVSELGDIINWDEDETPSIWHELDHIIGILSAVSVLALP